MRMKRFLDCYIPTETCNLRCHYCYITQQRKFENKVVSFTHGPQVIRKALSIKRLGGPCLINVCAGGETLLGREVIDVVKELLAEGHYLMIVTNGTLTDRFDEIALFPPDLLKRLFFKFSFHYLELLRVNQMNDYFANIIKMQKAGCSFTVEITPSDELIPHIEDIKKISMEKLGALPHVTIARDDKTKSIDVLSSYSFEEYKKIWGVFNSDLFAFKSTIFYNKRREFCYAGDWSLYIDLVKGTVRQCYCGKLLDNLFENIDKPLKLEAIGNHCSIPHCYNGHAFLTLGTIPELDTPTYAQIRNRVDKKGRNWLQPEMKAFMEQKLQDNNKQYSEYAKRCIFFKGGLIAFETRFLKITRLLKKRVLEKLARFWNCESLR